jgi:hypothetical protein
LSDDGKWVAGSNIWLETRVWNIADGKQKGGDIEVAASARLTRLAVNGSIEIAGTPYDGSDLKVHPTKAYLV